MEMTNLTWRQIQEKIRKDEEFAKTLDKTFLTTYAGYQKKHREESRKGKNSLNYIKGFLDKLNGEDWVSLIKKAYSRIRNKYLVSYGETTKQLNHLKNLLDNVNELEKEWVPVEYCYEYCETMRRFNRLKFSLGDLNREDWGRSTLTAIYEHLSKYFPVYILNLLEEYYDESGKRKGDPSHLQDFLKDLETWSNPKIKLPGEPGEN